MNHPLYFTLKFLKSKIPFKPIYAIILGTGLGALADEVVDKIEIPYEEIPGFVKSTAPSHQGALIAGYINKAPVIVFKGRFHFYEGHTMQQVVYPVRIAKLLGVKYLFVTNAAGSLNSDFKMGSIVVINDHINFMGTNPLIGENQFSESVWVDGVEYKEYGERFPSLHEPYDKELISQAIYVARKNEFDIKAGVYCAVSGPSLETRAECMMIKNLGADMVGMSTVPEVIAAIHCGLKVFGASVITNMGNIFHAEPHSQEEIRHNADKASKNLLILIRGLIEKIDNG